MAGGRSTSSRQRATGDCSLELESPRVTHTRRLRLMQAVLRKVSGKPTLLIISPRALPVARQARVVQSQFFNISDGAC